MADNNENNYDTEARLEFLKLGEADTATLKEFRQVLETNLDGILDQFYSHVVSVPELKAKFPSQEMLDHARAEQKKHWLNNVFAGNFGSEFMETVSTIGRAHVRVDLAPRWYMAGYCFTLNKLVDLATKTYGRDQRKLSAVLQAINKAVFLDMDLAISIYNDVSQESMRALNQDAKNFANTVQGMVQIVASASTELLSTSQSMESTASTTSEQATAVAAAAEEASTNVQTVASAAEELSSSIDEISRQVAQSTEISNNAVAEAQRTNDMVQGLAQAATKIGEVVKLINDIASQTNLLALNATIEAARAGEAGKGFAVVASEVKNLANQTAKATDEISTQINDIQAATKDAVRAIGAIGDTINSISETASTIASAVEEQGAATQEIARNVEQASAGTSEVTTHIQDVTQAAGMTGNAARDVSQASNELSSQAEMLSSEVSSFVQRIEGH